MNTGKIILINGPMGSGKSTLCHLLLEHYHTPVYYCHIDQIKRNMINCHHNVLYEFIEVLIQYWTTRQTDVIIDKAMNPERIKNIQKCADNSNSQCVHILLECSLQTSFERVAHRRNISIDDLDDTTKTNIHFSHKALESIKVQHPPNLSINTDNVNSEEMYSQIETYIKLT